ncbi:MULTISPECIES: ABC transporter ATP-binding protein [unclassified Aureimonas]|uniref:ABC transporter ATP-binding protein n=1 Tax=unclassified Aureimonas TaxID=2615206 RepID=UPI0006F84BE8|nr:MULTISPECIES: ABC transporter ATP-binding protein [unclassified Aureimonas]KQT52498.1 glutathione ABC transporter ATP-binding protein [Aureimonas sp. Leaf427]KQT77601.1 glutathione ABC transporter ATP-binding protein [Aureimonas sp. Leaf460]
MRDLSADPLDGAGASPSPVLSVKGLTVDLVLPGRERTVLDDISFEVRPREIIGIVGASGAGKTVLSKAVVNWITPPLAIRAGTVSFRGRSLLGLPAEEMRRLRRDIAYVGADPMGALDPTLPVGRQIVEKLRAVVPEIGRAEAEPRVIDLLAAVRIPSAKARFHDYPSQFSGGMMQRALIVDAMVSNPALLVADNVTQPLDVTVAAQVIRLMRELSDRFETSVLFVSSSLPVAREAASRILVVAEGRLVEEQATEDLVANPRHAYTRDLVAQTPAIWSASPALPRAAETNEAPLAVIRLNDVSQTYKVKKRGSFGGTNELRAVRNVTFDVFKGDSFAVVGESGCGKSTLMRLLSRLESPSAGEVLCEGRDIAKLSGASLLAFRRKLQLVLQDPFASLPPRTAIGAMLETPLRIHGWRDARLIREKVREVMDDVGLPVSLYEELPVGLSAGQRQRINVARAMVLDPEILLMDETLSALDQGEQFKLLALFEKLQRRHSLTYIFISHDLAMVRKVCNRIAVMYLGEVVELADNERLFFDPGHPYTKALLSAMPTLEARRYRPEDCLLEGEPPSPIDLPKGCSFRSRCPQAFAPCAYRNPHLTVRGAQDLASCHLVPSPQALAAQGLSPSAAL